MLNAPKVTGTWQNFRFIVLALTYPAIYYLNYEWNMSPECVNFLITTKTSQGYVKDSTVSKNAMSAFDNDKWSSEPEKLFFI